MTTLNARANQAYNDLIEDWNREHPDWEWMGFDHQRDAFESGWETGYKAAREDIARALAAVPAEVYPEDIFPPDGTSVDCQSARVMRFAYPAAATIALQVGGEE